MHGEVTRVSDERDGPAVPLLSPELAALAAAVREAPTAQAVFGGAGTLIATSPAWDAAHVPPSWLDADVRCVLRDGGRGSCRRR